MRSFHVGAGALGMLASAYFYPYALMQIPVGILADRWGARKTVTLFGLVAGVGGICLALVPSFGLAVLSRALVGFGLSAIFVPSMTLFCNWFSDKEYIIVSGVFVAVGGIGWLTAATPLALLVQRFGWVNAFVIIGSVTLCLAILGWFIVADRPEEKGLPAVVAAKRDIRQEGLVLPVMTRVFREPTFRLLACWNALMGVSIFGFCGLWAGPFLRDAYGLSRTGAANVLTMIAFALIFGGPFLSYLSERLRSRKRVLVLSSIIHVACWLVLLCLPAGLPYPALYAVFFFLGLTAGAAHPVVITAAKELFPLEMAGASVGMANIFPFVGGVVSQPLIGLLLDAVGKTGNGHPVSSYRAAFVLFFVLSLAGLWVAARTRENARLALSGASRTLALAQGSRTNRHCDI